MSKLTKVPEEVLGVWDELMNYNLKGACERGFLQFSSLIHLEIWSTYVYLNVTCWIITICLLFVLIYYLYKAYRYYEFLNHPFIILLFKYYEKSLKKIS